MKKSLLVVALWLGCFVWPVAGFSAGSVTEAGNVKKASPATSDAGDFVTTFTCTADASDGSYPEQVSTDAIDGFVYMVTVEFGATAPTSGTTDISLKDDDGVPIMGGALDNMTTTAGVQAVPYVGSIYGARRVNGDLTITITGNSVNSAVMIVRVYFYR